MKFIHEEKRLFNRLTDVSDVTIIAHNEMITIKNDKYKKNACKIFVTINSFLDKIE